MSFNPGFQIGQIVGNDDIRRVFKCGMMGGMRRSHKTNTMVIVTDHTKGLYDDRWEDNVLHYTGMGKNGDQSLDFQQNRTLNESKVNGVEVHLFEVLIEKEYIYLGQVELCDQPYQERQLGDDSIERNVWIFPVSLKSTSVQPDIIEIQAARHNEKNQKRAKRLSTEKLKAHAERKSGRKSSRRSTSTLTYDRDPYVSEYAKRRADGICELCNMSAPFKNGQGEPYLETHHIKWLADGGEDSIENTVAICPNCHRKMHVVKNTDDVAKLQQIHKYL